MNYNHQDIQMAQTVLPEITADKNIPAIPRLNLDQPRWDQRTFYGRLQHFFNITDPRTAFCSEKELDDAKDLITKYKYVQLHDCSSFPQVKDEVTSTALTFVLHDRVCNFLMPHTTIGHFLLFSSYSIGVLV